MSFDGDRGSAVAARAAREQALEELGFLGDAASIGTATSDRRPAEGSGSSFVVELPPA